jgi:hypothetical protein
MDACCLEVHAVDIVRNVCNARLAGPVEARTDVVVVGRDEREEEEATRVRECLT